MPYELTYSVKPEYLEADIRVNISEGKTLREALGRWKEVAGLCRENERNRVLVTMEFNGSYDMETKFKLAKGAPAIGWSQDLKLAVVIKDPVHFTEQLFTETAMNRLGYEMKLFQKPRQAKKWLLAD